MTAIDLLKEKNLKVTPQRISILNYLLSTKEHPSAETIYQNILTKHPNISLATIYKTLDNFKKHGLVTEFNVGENCFRYDANTEEHLHFACTDCGCVIDVDLPDEYLKFDKYIENSYDLKVSAKKIFLHGLCKNCFS